MTSATSTTTYAVNGMTCGHCELSIREEVGEVAGVDAVTADHVTGAVVVTGSADRSAVEAAIRDAGYEVSG
ncbi:MAG: cation transporter [Solirubrobacteraceae bacterium]|nr:cation transporter [Solirubrobacteraceae bacterium]